MSALPPFQQLLDRYAEDVLAYLIATVGPVEAEDCFQETFLAALRGYPELEDGRNLRGWLFTIAHRKAIDSARQRQRRPTPAGHAAEVAELMQAVSAGLEDTAASAVSSGRPEAGVVTKSPTTVGTNAADGLWQAVADLPPKQRGAVTLRFVADLSHRDIARALDCSEAAARRSLHEGLNKLREVWR